MRRDRGDDEWRSRERWREFFDERVPNDTDLSEEQLASLREAEIDDRLAASVDDEEIERRRRCAHYRLLDRLDTDLIRTYLDEDAEFWSPRAPVPTTGSGGWRRPSRPGGSTTGH
ncbi:hypothetical protein [Halomicrobium salinisoli]|uniref:hypothetical protein n=1 Tax=Halomicrobium salinisoli TaxID=2878391 RepID=UPI001CEFFE7A|nr:hypothetical protein [Halomicrobium salinisoli]